MMGEVGYWMAVIMLLAASLFVVVLIVLVWGAGPSEDVLD